MGRPRRQPGAGTGLAAALLGEPVPEQLDGLLDSLVHRPASAGLVQGDGPNAGAALRRLAVQLPRQPDELPGDREFPGLGVEVRRSGADYCMLRAEIAGEEPLVAG
jgi:hypothetical protein